MNKKMLTFEYDPKEERLEIHTNKLGAEYLIQLLSAKLKKVKNKEHYHLMTPDWGGDELTNEKQCNDNELINHVVFFYWGED